MTVDDNLFNIYAFKMLLQTLDANTDVAYNGQEGLDKMSQKINTCCKKPYKIIFVDLNMPIMNGIQMMKQVRQWIQQGPMKAYEHS